MKFTRFFSCFLFGLVSIYFAHAGELSETAVRIDTGIEEDGVITSLEMLAQEIEKREHELSRIRRRFQAKPDSVDVERLRKARAEVREHRLLFERLAVNVDVGTFNEKTETKFDWQQQLGKLLKPIMAEVEFATRHSRAIGELRSKVNEITAERDIAKQALDNIDKLTGATVSPTLNERLEKLHQLWKKRFLEAQDRINVINRVLEKKLAEQESPLDAGISYIHNFILTRGQNLLLSIIAFCAVFFGVRLLVIVWGLFRKRKTQRGLGSRLATIIVQVFSILGGVLAMLMVFSFTADWFLFALLLIFLIGIGWASFNTLPQYIEILRIMMNSGAVREGERIVLDGIPWRVEGIGFRARLVNPLLDGGEQILPLKMLVGKYSRPAGKSEEWFPCRQGDLVELADGKTGHVSYQTPSAVQIVEADGARTVYQTSAFFALNPRNMSACLRVTSTFGVDYKHQAECTTRIPEVMLESLKRELPKIVYSANILGVNVLFKAAGSSSLDYEIRVDLTGDDALFFKTVEYQIQRILVNVCNEHHWEIPFAQVTIHQAVPAASASIFS
ncbi:MAG: mechanosensitive ion channel [Chitinispirillaceae bacterium]|nr:mechanosensitive ion channel [Chitinispirillaceae bacterium]